MAKLRVTLPADAFEGVTHFTLPAGELAVIDGAIEVAAKDRTAFDQLVENFRLGEHVEQIPESSPKAGPAVRARAEELGVELADVTGTGKGGAITKADVENAAAQGSETSAGSGAQEG